jgi:hypothetical protein
VAQQTRQIGDGGSHGRGFAECAAEARSAAVAGRCQVGGLRVPPILTISVQ